MHRVQKQQVKEWAVLVNLRLLELRYISALRIRVHSALTHWLVPQNSVS